MGNSQQCFSSRLGAEIVVVCAPIKEQAICLQKLPVVLTLLFNFLEEYIIVKQNLTTAYFLALYWKCACVGPIFSRCVNKMCSYKEVSGYVRS